LACMACVIGRSAKETIMVPARTSKATAKAHRAPTQQKAARKKPVRATASKHGIVSDPTSEFSGEGWYDMVATAAYYRAESRGFEGGSPEDDWFEAEAELREQMARAEDTYDMESRDSPDADRSDIEREGE
jgi:Protein of unknown function (DUF2934)